MYGVWSSDLDANRNKARIELIQFLLKQGARAQADSELIALAAALPPDPAAHLQTAQLFQQALDYPGALAQYEEALHLDPGNSTALAGAGETAYHSGNYSSAQRYLRSAVNANPADAESRQLLASTDLVLLANPFHSHISDAERNRRINAAFSQAENRLTACAQQAGIDLTKTDLTNNNLKNTAPASALPGLQARWQLAKPDLNLLRSPAETDLPDSIMDVVFQIEEQTAATCGQPQGLDLALLLISQKREAAGQ
jgi:tetratricopeptide (TPR) repeat protein